MKEEYTFSRINNLALAPRKFVLDCTEGYRTAVRNAAKTAFYDENKKIIMLAGPSSSGKTTTASLISEEIESLGGKAYVVSLDDFYRSHDEAYPLNENGEPDYESVEALDTALLRSCLCRLLECGESLLPIFDFTSGTKRNNAKKITLSQNDIIITEGLHALNPAVTAELDRERLYNIYVSVSSRVYENDGSVLLSKRELRFIRRAVRDSLFRAMPVERTFGIWESVTRGEDKYLFPFENLADVKINSFHPCEPCVLSRQAIDLFSEVGDGEYKEKAALLTDKLKLFRNIDISFLPSDSLLREFTG